MMKMRSWTSTLLLASNEDDVSNRLQADWQRGEARPGMSRSARPRTGLEQASARNTSQPSPETTIKVLQKRCLMTKKMRASTIKMTTRHLQHFGVQVQT
uniref:Transposase n=1 Tax=Peronospora matthiolae TaxID=2874970 RepID=A0AAV1V7D1_9STRA